MQFTGALSALDLHWIERRELQVETGRLEAEIWRLRSHPNSETAIAKRKAEIARMAASIGALDRLIDRLVRQTGRSPNHTPGA